MEKDHPRLTGISNFMGMFVAGFIVLFGIWLASAGMNIMLFGMALWEISLLVFGFLMLLISSLLSGYYLFLIGFGTLLGAACLFFGMVEICIYTPPSFAVIPGLTMASLLAMYRVVIPLVANVFGLLSLHLFLRKRYEK